MNEWTLLMGGALLLYFGAGWFVGGASALALALRVPQILVGLTVVAYGTSAPEVIVGIEAARAGHGEVALGNVIGSNIANIGLILGLAALFEPARVDGALRRRELPVLIASTALVPLILLDGLVSRWEAGGLLLIAAVYTGWMVRAARSASAASNARADVVTTRAVADVAGAPKSSSGVRAALAAVAGLGVLLVGGNLFIEGAVSAAHRIGISDRLVGLTIVAIGTSLPELVTSLVAAKRGHSDLAVGNVLGSNIFNILLCLGASGLAGPIAVPLRLLHLDLIALMGMTLVAARFIRTERVITRAEGAVAVVLYGLFIMATLERG